MSGSVKKRYMADDALSTAKKSYLCRKIRGHEFIGSNYYSVDSFWRSVRGIGRAARFRVCREKKRRGDRGGRCCFGCFKCCLY